MSAHDGDVLAAHAAGTASTGDEAGAGSEVPDAPSAGAVPRWARRVVVAAAAVVTALPFVSALIAWKKGWMPTSDWASVVIRAYDTFSARPPLVGIYSSATTSAGSTRSVYHPGPLQEWLLAGPIHLLAPSTAGILLGSALLVSAPILTVLVVAHRRGGWCGLAAATVAVSAYMLATGPVMLYAPLHTWMATYAMIGFLASAWAVLDHDEWFWPIAVFFLSVAGQAQVAFMVPGAVVLVVVATVRIVRAVTRGRRDAVPSTVGATDRTVRCRRRSRRVAATTVIVTAACWAGPLWDQFAGTGNLWALFVTGRDGSAVGPLWALRELAGTLAIPPSWISLDLHLSITVVGGTRVIWHTSALQWTTAAVVAVALGLSIRRAVRRRRRLLAALGIVAVAALGGCFIASVLMPDEPFSLLGHREIWRSAGLFTWGFLAASLVDVAVEASVAIRRLPRRIGSPWTGTVAAAAVVSVVVVASVGTIGRTSPERESGSSAFGAVETFTAVATPYCAQGPIVVRPTTLVDAPAALGLIAMLTMRGCTVHAASLAQILPGPLHRADGTEPTTLTIDGFDLPPPGCQRVAVYDPADAPPRYRDFTRTLERLQRSGLLYLFACPHRSPVA